MQILWDEPKRLTNLQNRNLDFATLTQEFFAGAVVLPARKNRFKAVAYFDGLILAVIFRPLGTEAISVISMRRANRTERDLL